MDFELAVAALSVFKLMEVRLLGLLEADEVFIFPFIHT